MKLSIKILEKVIDIKSDLKTLESELTNHSAEIDEVINQGKGLEKVFIGEILEISAHPNADKMRITKTKVGDEIFQIVCGANNIRVGQKVPVVLAGGILPGGFEIKKADKRGVESNGMICSGEELGIEEKSDGIMELSQDAPVGESFSKYFGLDDKIFFIENTVITNRPDLFSHIGFAREIIANKLGEKKKSNEKIFDLDFYSKINNSKEFLQTKGKKDFPLKINILDKGICKRMQSLSISGIKNSKSPDWIKKALESVGIRSISLLVDITNLTMVFCGVPIHAFDMQKISGTNIKMRLSKKGEKIITLDEKERELAENIIIMEDEQKIFDLCGIMGGQNSGIDENTNDIWLHVVSYDPVLIRRGSISLAHRTEASAIYEKNIFGGNIPNAMIFASKLILEYGGENVQINSDIFDYNEESEEERILNLSKKKLDQIIGFEIGEKRVLEILESLGFEVSLEDGNFKTKVPYFRFRDINIEEDLIEEVLRINGFESIGNKLPNVQMKKAEIPLEFEILEKIKNNLCQSGLYETINFSFLGEKLLSKSNISKENHIEIQNPISEDLSLMRRSLLPYLFELVEKNQLQEKEFGFFETGNVFEFTENKKNRIENNFVSGVYYSKDFFYLKGILENLFDEIGLAIQFKKIDFSKEPVLALYSNFSHKGKSGSLNFEGKSFGIISALSPRISKNFGLSKELVFFEFDFSKINLEKIRKRKFKKVSGFQASVIDLNFLMEKNVEVGGLIRAIKSLSDLIQDVNVVDVYEGEKIGQGKKSITFSIVYQSYEKTLNDQDLKSEMNKVIEKMKTFGANLRES